MKRIIKLALTLLVIAGAVYGWHEYRDLTAVPTTRLAAGEYYPEMPPDYHRRYLQLPVDHFDQASGNFTGFYYLSPGFQPGGNVIFWLCDNQQELVGVLKNDTDFDYFEESLDGLSYVLIGNRGVSPTLFPEVFNPDGSVNYPLAVRLYGSGQQVEDIEAVRQDLMRQGLLPPDSRIMLYGGSGGGLLEQQYLDRYGSRVSRVLIENSGAPDLARQHGATFIRGFYDSNPGAADIYYNLSQKGPKPSLAYVLFKLGLEGEKEMQYQVIEGQANGTDFQGKYLYLKNWVKPANNYPLIRFMLEVPMELEVKVRIYEVLGADLKSYQPTSPREVNLGYDWTREVLVDFLQADQEGLISPPEFNLNRSRFTGEVMVWSGTEDQDFPPQMGQWISGSYPNSRLAVFNDSHRRNRYPDYYRDFRKAFFTTGLHSPETQAFFSDPRQVSGSLK